MKTISQLWKGLTLANTAQDDHHGLIKQLLQSWSFVTLTHSHFHKSMGCTCRMQEQRHNLFQAHHTMRTKALMWGSYIAWNGVPHHQVTLTCYIDNFIGNGFLFLSAAVMCLRIFRVQISQGWDAELNIIHVGVQCLWFLLLCRTLSSWETWHPIVKPLNAQNQVLWTAFHIWTAQGNIWKQ